MNAKSNDRFPSESFGKVAPIPANAAGLMVVQVPNPAANTATFYGLAYELARASTQPPVYRPYRPNWN
jgi:hypothetical protein